MDTDEFKKLLTDETAISPVLGGVLLIAITLGLAATVGGYVTGFAGDLTQTAPDAQIEFDYDANNENLVVTHDGGDPFNSDNTRVLRWANDESLNATPSPSEGMEFNSGNFEPTADNLNDASSDPEPGEAAVPEGSLQAGDVIGENSGKNFETTDTVDLAWTGSEGDSSSVIATFEGPDATSS